MEVLKSAEMNPVSEGATNLTVPSPTTKNQSPRQSKPKSHKCDKCPKSFTNELYLIRHSRTHSAEVEAHKCEVCSKTFALLSSLKTHSRSHTSEKPYKCDSCSKSFALPAHLNSHRLSHTNEKLFKCDKCPKAFVKNESLAMHVMKKHTDINNFSTILINEEDAYKEEAMKNAMEQLKKLKDIEIVKNNNNELEATNIHETSVNPGDITEFLENGGSASDILSQEYLSNTLTPATCFNLAMHFYNLYNHYIQIYNQLIQRAQQ